MGPEDVSWVLCIRTGGDINQWPIPALHWFSFAHTDVDEGITMNFNNCSEGLCLGSFLLSRNLTFLSCDCFSMT